jgi:circadian clock protein KaiC
MTLRTTGDAGLDAILGGGLPGGSLVVVAGAPGSGKTILAQQICFANAAADRRSVYYTTWSEPHEKLVRHLRPFSFFDEEALGERVEFVHLADLIAEGDGIDSAAAEILRKSVETSPAVIVVDSSKSLHDVVDPAHRRQAIYDLASKVSYSDALLVFVGEYALAETRSEPEFAVADGILLLEHEQRGPLDRRWLRVLKLRGADAAPGQHSFRIGPDGLRVFPRLETALPRGGPPLDGRAAFGIAELDAILGGGLPRGDAALLLGPSGVGKTVLSLHFVQAGLEAGERCMFVSLQETEEALLSRAAAAGWDWRPHLDDRLVLRHVPPVEIDLDEVGAVLRDDLAREPIDRVVVDSLAELAFASDEPTRLPGYIWAFAGFVRAAGGTTLITNELAALGQGDIGGLSFIFDDVVFLRYVELESKLRRGVNVLKMRRSRHEQSLVEFEVDSGGISVVGEIRGVTGLLGWSALRGDTV